MSKLTNLGDIVYTEKYTKDGEEKKAYKNAGTLFQREDGSYTIRQFGSWFNVYPKKVDEKGYQEAKQAAQESVPEDFDDSIPFAPIHTYA